MEELIKRITENYKLDISKVTKNEESTDGNVYILNTNKRKIVMKIYDDLNHTKSICKLHKYLSSINLYIPKIVSTKDNKDYMKYNNKYIVLYTFLEGAKLKDYQIDNIIIKKVAKEIRKMHDKTEGTNMFNLKEVPFKIDKTLTRCSMLHFDLTKVNIFYNDKNDKIGIIDFDDAKYGPSVVDVAICCSLLFISKSKGIDNDGINTFINEYYSNDNKNEIMFIKEIALEWTKYILNNNQFDTSTNESFKLKKELIEKELSI